MKKVGLLAVLLFLPSLLFANYLEDLLRVATVKELQAARDAGADFTFRFDDMETALMIAAERNQHPEVIEWLVGLGIDVNAREEDQKTALMMAAEKNRNVEIIKTLIRLGADVNAVEEDGETETAIRISLSRCWKRAPIPIYRTKTVRPR